MADANSLKDQGNKAFAAKDWDTAITLFSKAIDLDPKNHVLYSNRSAANAGKKEYSVALDDAEKCIQCNPSWAKGYLRKGAALHGLHSYDDAIQAYETGLKLEDSPAMRKGLQEVKDAQNAASGGDEPLGLGKIFSDPAAFAKLAANPRTSKHLADPAFLQQIQQIQRNPALAQNALQDPRMIDALGVLMGIDIQAQTRPEGSSDDFPQQSARPSTPPPAARPKETRPTPAQEDVEMEDVDEEEAEAKKQAEASKNLGSEAYKKREFDTAISHFEKAWDIYPKDVTFLSNAAAAYLEKGDYDKAIEICEKAVDEGRSLRSNYTLIAKALGRIGSAYQRKGDLPSAIKYFQKSLTEHRTPDVLNKLREAERLSAEEAKKAYIDPEKSHVAREEGNVKFKTGDFVGAVKDYTESIKRDPSDARGYNNRAAAYTKLAALPEALKDVNEAIKVDPNFVKAYIRKSTVLFAMREYTKAIEAVQEATNHDSERQHTKEIQQQEMKCQQALFAQRGNESQEETLQRAMRDPEVAEIMNDPIMQSILQQAQENPQALQDHLKNPVVRQKIEKLINAGIIRTR
ncbi:hypothetical protein Agabi119p4_4509 [Agaricus bisporus var. burnettii]|uniref:STI1 domain-containing protein n=1 Tax=Agaricus bisporus var. burnettii TaxID=192524 RepID=A0A8H7KHC8_AGABI|nr:hypothetical protein Agabi119p4_4509 [Agaricus bisporus var. burnettii]